MNSSRQWQSPKTITNLILVYHSKNLLWTIKNGFYNARTLAEHEPELLDRKIASKDLDKDFVAGLKAGKKEYKVRQTMARMKHEREIREIDKERDKGIVL